MEDGPKVPKKKKLKIKTRFYVEKNKGQDQNKKAISFIEFWWLCTCVSKWVQLKYNNVNYGAIDKHQH